MQYVAVVVNKMSFLVIHCSTPSHTKAWGVAVDAAGRLLLPSPTPAAPSLSDLMVRSSTHASGLSTDRRAPPSQKDGPSWYGKDDSRLWQRCINAPIMNPTTMTTPLRCTKKTNPRPTLASVTRSRPIDCCSQAARHVINKGNSKLRLRCVQLTFCTTQ